MLVLMMMIECIKCDSEWKSTTEQ